MLFRSHNLLRFVTLLTFSVASRPFAASAPISGTPSLTTSDQIHYVCPMHSEVRQLTPGFCPICGMELIPVGPNGVHLNIPTTLFLPTIKSDVRTILPPVAGQQVSAILKLARLDGSPVTFADLKIAHTKRIHLLIVDDSLSDYSHVHPVETDTPGEYAFSFVPQHGGNYSIWADLLPVATGHQEYVRARIMVAGTPVSLDERLNHVASVDGIWFDLSTEDRTPFVAGYVTSIKVLVTDAQGHAVSNLEPLMGAFAHGVGFTPDHESVMHVHPIDQIPQKESDRGGPYLHFKLVSRHVGFLKFYVQVQIGGKNVFAGFGLNVASPLHPPARVFAQGS